MSTLTEQFIAAQSDTITHLGRVVKAIVRMPVRDGVKIRVVRKRVGSDRPQGLKLALNSGQLMVNEQRSDSVVLWSTTSPDEVELRVRGSDARSLEVWNCWSMGGVDSAWIGNAGIVTKTTASGMILRCSDGVGAADFNDLEAEIVIVR